MGKTIQRKIRTNSVKGNITLTSFVPCELLQLNLLNRFQHDIREAPTNIRDSYKMYYKMKTTFLEETLSDALEDDAFDLSLLESSAQLDGSLTTSLSGTQTPDVTQLTSDDSAILTNRSTTISSPTVESAVSPQQPAQTIARSINSLNVEPRITEFEAEKLDSFNENAWGMELNRTKSTSIEQPGDAKSSGGNSMSLRKTMSDKLFRNSSFVKRNPRKSLSRSSLTSSQLSIGSGGSQRETLPDLETILSQKSMKDNEVNASQDSIVDHSVASGMIVGGKAGSNVINTIDYDWLSRCNQDNDLNSNDSEAMPTVSQLMPPKSVNQTYGLSNINANVLQTLEAAPLSIHAKSNLKIASNNNATNSAVVNNTDDDDEVIENSEDESANTSAVQIQSIRKSLNKRKYTEIDKPIVTASNVDANANDNAMTVNSETAPRTSTDRKVVKVKRVAKKAVEPQPTVSRRSTRTTRKQYKQTSLPGESDDENGEDPFAGDDSDADPDFDAEMMKKKKREISSGDEVTDNEVNDTAAETKPKSKTTKKEKKTRKMSPKVVRKRVATKQPSIKPDKVRKVRRVVAIRKKSNTEEANADNVAEEMPDDYLMEFGIDKVKSVPRIAVGELKKNTQRFTEYVHRSAALQVTSKPTTMKNPTASGRVLTSKNSMAKEKLEKRVAAGTVNENFVRINLRKKVFVRGKKTVNFSRYKKQQWRNKKAAALTGPEMDMGGCDGGLLMCFQCGQPGHFAQNCKIKSEFIFV